MRSILREHGKDTLVPGNVRFPKLLTSFQQKTVFHSENIRHDPVARPVMRGKGRGQQTVVFGDDETGLVIGSALTRLNGPAGMVRFATNLAKTNVVKCCKKGASRIFATAVLSSKIRGRNSAFPARAENSCAALGALTYACMRSYIRAYARLSRNEELTFAAEIPAGTQDCTCFALRSAARHISQFYDQLMAPVGLRITQFSILAKLNRLGPMTINALAENMVVDRTLGRNVLPLERDGLLAIQPSTSDRRPRSYA
jgi:hypothetical protein